MSLENCVSLLFAGKEMQYNNRINKNKHSNKNVVFFFFF